MCCSIDIKSTMSIHDERPSKTQPNCRQFALVLPKGWQRALESTSHHDCPHRLTPAPKEPHWGVRPLLGTPLWGAHVRHQSRRPRLAVCHRSVGKDFGHTRDAVVLQYINVRFTCVPSIGKTRTGRWHNCVRRFWTHPDALVLQYTTCIAFLHQFLPTI